MRSLLALALVLSGSFVLAGCASSQSANTKDEPPDSATYFAQNAAAMAQNLGITDPPNVEMVRVIELEEWAPVQIACMNEAGFAATLTDDGEGISWPALTDGSLIENMNLARYVCEVKYPVDPRFYDPLTNDQLRFLYAYRSGELIDCLAAAGYSVSGPPSESVFIESEGVWSPYSDIRVSEGDSGLLQRKCPQNPDELYDQ